MKKIMVGVVALLSICLLAMAGEERKTAASRTGPGLHRQQMMASKPGIPDFHKKEDKKPGPLPDLPYKRSAGAVLLAIDGPAVGGEISVADEVDAYEFAVTTAGNYGVQTLAGTGGTTMDTMLYLYGPDDANIFITSDDDGGPGALSFIGMYLVPGTYYVNVRGYSTSTGEYSVQVITAGSISGKVTDPSSAGVSDAEVGLYEGASNSSLDYGYTDGSGNYVFIVAAGTYKLAVDPNNPAYAFEWYNNQYSWYTADTVTVTAGNATTANVQLGAAGYITGNVAALNGAPIDDLYIGVCNLNGEWISYDYSDSSGNYSVGSLPSGSYMVRFYDYHYPGFASEWYNNQADFSTANPVAVTAGSTTPNINAQLSGCRGNEYDDLVGTWSGQGVYYRSSQTGAFFKLGSPATVIAAADLDYDCIDDLIGIWPAQAGVWVKYSATGTWAKLASTARHITAGDMDGDGDRELLGTWDGQGVYYLDGSTWVKLASPATLIHAGDFDHDGTDDLIGIWPSQGGVWAKLSDSGAWQKLSSTAQDITTGDANHSGWYPEFIGTWDGQGVYYLEYDTWVWTQMASPATLITCGDLDGDWGERDDLVGVWPSQGGVWVKYNTSGTWTKLSSTATDIVVGKMRAYGSTQGAAETQGQPVHGDTGGPETAGYYQDLSLTGPGGAAFAFRDGGNLVPAAGQGPKPDRPGPGEPGFVCREGEKLTPCAGPDAVEAADPEPRARE